MMRSMYSGVSGLRIHQTKMDVIGNNIANVNTIGFKASRVTFSEVFSQTLRGASGANENKGGTNPMQIGLGSSLSSIDVNMTEGTAQRTDNPLDMKIEGDGFFIVSDVTGNKFTRAGAFLIDEAGNLTTPNGLNVMGWLPDPTTGKIEKTKVQNLKILSPAKIYSEPKYTEQATIGGNVNKNDPQVATTGTGVPFTLSLYDSLGYPYSAEFRIKSTGTPNQYQITLGANDITDENGNTITTTPVTQTVGFDPATGKVTSPIPATLLMTGMTTGFSQFPATGISVDFSAVTLFAGNTTIEAEAGGENKIGSGNKAGSLSGFEVGSDGKILGRYSNGQTKLLCQIPIAQFKNPAGLQKLGSNLFAPTNNSGDFDGIGTDITSTGGNFNSGVLEMSNVDLSRAFTEMITTQRGFQANSRIITSSDEILQELVNLKR